MHPMSAFTFKTCPSCRERVGEWRPECECGYQFGSPSGAAPERAATGGATAAKRSATRKQLAGPELARVLDSVSEGNDRPRRQVERQEATASALVQTLDARYPRRPFRTAAVCLGVAIVAFATTGPLALVVLPLGLAGWSWYRGRRVAGHEDAARALDEVRPLVNRSPEVVDDALALLGVDP
jgi:hypothetical protein